MVGETGFLGNYNPEDNIEEDSRNHREEAEDDPEDTDGGRAPAKKFCDTAAYPGDDAVASRSVEGGAGHLFIERLCFL